MKSLISALVVCVCACWAQQKTFSLETGKEVPQQVAAPALPNLPDDAVIAVFDDGGKFTMGELRRIFDVLPPESRQNALVQQKAFVQQWALMRKLALMAEKEGLDQQSPAREQILYSRLMVLTQTKLGAILNSNAPSDDAVRKYYDENKDRFKQVRVKAIYVAFGDSGASGKKALTEAEAKDKAEKLLAQVRSGADFVKLAKANSDDETSREKEGDFATFKAQDNVPEAIKKAVFALKQGETTDPVRQAGGFYLLRAEEITYRTVDETRTELTAELQQKQYAKWLADVNDSNKVQFPNPAFPPGGPAAK